MKKARDACCVGFLCICFGIAAILFGTVDSRVDALCNDIESINREEQRLCRPPKKQNVEIRNSWDNLMAYRYAVDDLPETYMRTTHWEYEETVWNDEPRQFRFELSAGGTVNYSCQGKNGMVFDVFLMTRAQHKEFESKGRTDSVWSNKTTADSSMSYTTSTADLYFIVSSAPYGTLGVNQSVKVTTSVYNVSKSTAKETCTIPCTFKDVQNDEVVILEYTGSSKSVVTFVYSGKGGFRDLRLVLIIVMSAMSAIFALSTIINLKNAIDLHKKWREQETAANDDYESSISNNFQTTPQGNTTVWETPDFSPSAHPPTYIQ